MNCCNFLGVINRKVFKSWNFFFFVNLIFIKMSNQRKELLKRIAKETNRFTNLGLRSDLGDFFVRGSYVIVLDTSAVIDIQQHIRNQGKQFAYSSSEDFVDSLLSDSTILVLPQGVMEEVESHSKIRINSHTREIPKSFFSYLEKKYTSGQEFLSRVQYGGDSEQVRYDSYWASLNGCKENTKKQEEGASLVDRSALTLACLLDGSKVIDDGRSLDVKRVVLLS